MKQDKDQIILTQMTFLAKHGVFAEEKSQKQPFIIDLTLYADLSAAALSDDLSLTIDYGQVYLLVKDIVENHSFNLLEHLAQVIIEAILKYPHVDKVRISIEKPQAKVDDAQFRARIVMERTRF
ncbi:MAG: dihydroneopterin aldolase [Bacillota bacterium]|jgi:dihydroneopterin aldolase